jgi:hypothetical protein
VTIAAIVIRRTATRSILRLAQHCAVATTVDGAFVVDSTIVEVVARCARRLTFACRTPLVHAVAC